PTLFPYTTLFRSQEERPLGEPALAGCAARVLDRHRTDVDADRQPRAGGRGAQRHVAIAASEVKDRLAGRIARHPVEEVLARQSCRAVEAVVGKELLVLVPANGGNLRAVAHPVVKFAFLSFPRLERRIPPIARRARKALQILA